MANETLSAPNTADSILLGSRIEILPSVPLPHFSTAGGMAYAARYRTDNSSDLYAIICTSPLMPRLELVTSMLAVNSPGLVNLVESGTINWADGTRAHALVYQKPSAPPMMANFDEVREPLSEDAINNYFITPMINVLGALSLAGITHCAIRPNNIFWQRGSATTPQLGECLSTPAGLAQPVLFEPIERALVTPLGRGSGSPTDDCYAFGVILALLTLGRNPFQGMDDAAIIDLKMQRGTFITMVGNNRISPAHVEILRGVLNDNQRERWTANNLELWLNGRRMPPKSSDAGRRATRQFEFAGKEYWQASTLACAMAENVGDAAKYIENESLSKWLLRSWNDEECGNSVTSIIKNLKQGGKSLRYEDLLVARVCIALDPSAPIRYRGLSVMPFGIGQLMAEAVVTTNNVSVLSEILASNLVGFWIQMQRDVTPELISMSQTFERIKALVEKNAFGCGFERATYELNPGISCLSPLVRNQYVTSPKLLLPALERIAGTGNRPREPVDRNISAFLVVREKRGEGLLDSLSAPEGSTKRCIAILGLLSELQYRYGPDKLPQLAAWLSPLIEPAVRRFLSKSLRENLHKLIRESTNAGSLSTLMRLIEDPQRLERDRQEFNAARVLYLNTQKEAAILEAKLKDRDNIINTTGKPMAASISSFLAIILVCAAVMRALFEVLFQ